MRYRGRVANPFEFEYIILIVQVLLRYRKSCLANVRYIAPGFAINRANCLIV
jgi:hypothetical protein